MRVVILALNIFSILSLNLYADDTDIFKGPAFTDPASQVSMPDEWKDRKIQYDSSYPDADVVITLDGQMYHAWEPLIEKFAKEKGLKIVTTRGTCGVSAGGMGSKSIDIGVFCCPPAHSDRLPGIKFHTMGIAALALIINPDNNVSNLTLKQAQQVFMGITRKWSDLNSKSGADQLVQPVARLHCKLRPGHWRLLLNNKDMFSPDLFEVGAMPDMISQVAMKPGAIGYETLWMADHYEKEGKGSVKFIKINGHSPDSPSDLKSGQYPLYRVYNFAYWEKDGIKNPHTESLIDYISDSIRTLNHKYRFIPSYELRKAGWKFKDGELVGEPDK